MGNELSRRNFLKGAGLAALGTAAASGLVATAAAPSWRTRALTGCPSGLMRPTLSSSATVDAAQRAAIAAADAGVSAIVLEKSSERDGGSTGCSGGHIHTCAEVDVDEWWNTFSHGASERCATKTI